MYGLVSARLSATPHKEALTCELASEAELAYHLDTRVQRRATAPQGLVNQHHKPFRALVVRVVIMCSGVFSTTRALGFCFDGSRLIPR